MKRRTLLSVGAVGGLLLAAGGYTAATFQPGWQLGRLTPAGRAVFGAVAPAVLADLWPGTGEALNTHLADVERAVAGMPPFVQAEVRELTDILATAAGRRLLVGLAAPWETASPAEVEAALRGMRSSTLVLRQQAYHALRNLTNACFFGNPARAARIGYTGQPKV